MDKNTKNSIISRTHIWYNKDTSDVFHLHKNRSLLHARDLHFTFTSLNPGHGHVPSMHRTSISDVSKPPVQARSHLPTLTWRHRRHPHSILRGGLHVSYQPKAEKTTLSKPIAPRVRSPSDEHVDTSTSPPFTTFLRNLTCCWAVITPTPLHVSVPFSGPLIYHEHTCREDGELRSFVLWKVGDSRGQQDLAPRVRILPGCQTVQRVPRGREKRTRVRTSALHALSPRGSFGTR